MCFVGGTGISHALGGMRSQENGGHCRGAPRHAVVGIIRRGILIYQSGGAPGTHVGRDHVALAEFAPSYHRATVTQVSLASLGFLSALVAWRLRSDARWLVGGGFLVSVIPFTALAILSTN
jgi:hypothetical protein